MASIVQFEVDDTSSTILYSPFGDIVSTANLSAGWNPYFEGSGFLTSLGETGSGDSMHITALDGASLSIQWHGTGIAVYGNATDASYSISIDNSVFDAKSQDLAASTGLLANINHLSNAHHTLTLTARTTMSDSTQSFVVFDKALITTQPPDSITSNNSNSNFTLESISDSDIKFSGAWSFHNASGKAYRQSNTTGDVANVSFLGTTLLLYGTTSPEGGNYSVTVDSIETFLSARSSFTNTDVLLYYSTGLDPTIVHNLTISNQDGSDITLPVGGIRAFSTDSPNAPTNTSSGSSSSANGYPAGTIAALVLAGVLVFVLLAWLFCYLVIYRPRMRSGRTGSSSKETEAGVLDIGPRGGSTYAEVYSPRRFSGGSKQWNEEMRNPPNIGTGIVFSRQDSTKDLTVPDHSRSPVQAHSSSQAKGKKPWFAGSRQEKDNSSPSFTLDLPLPAEQSRQSSRSWSAKSVLSSLSISTPSFASRKSSSIKRDNALPSTSNPRDRYTRPPIPKFHTRTSSQRPLLHFPSAFGTTPHQGSPQRVVNPPIVADNRTSVRYSQEAIGMLGPQVALRGLSPRTSERYSLPPPLQSLFDSEPQRQSREREQREPTSPVSDEPETSSFAGDYAVAGPSHRRIPSGVASAVVHTERPPSPSHKRASTGSRVRFEDIDTTTEASNVTGIEEVPRMGANPRAGVQSFLDLGGSSDDSTRTHSDQPSNASSADHSHSEPGVRSRWSTTTGTMPQETDHSDIATTSNSEYSTPDRSAIFPFPTSLPASPHHPEGHRPSPPRPQSLAISDAPSNRLHAHPFPEESQMSPTESVPTSITASDLRFGAGRSDAESGPSSRNPAYLPPHPPLPARQFWEAL